MSVAVLFFASAAAGMTVTTSSDEGGGCTLRETIAAVNANNSGGPCGSVVSGGTTPINLPAGHYTLTAGELQIGASANLAITGANQNDPAQTVIDAGKASRVFEVTSGAQATLAGVEITGGQTVNGANETTPLHSGGLGGNGGGILNHGVLTLEHVLLTGNLTGHGGKGADGDMSATASRNPSSGGTGGSGGGIYNDTGASLTVEASTISANGTGEGGPGGNAAMGVSGLGNIPSGADGGKGAYSGSGGGIFNASGASVTIGTTTVSGNFTGRGGAGGSGGGGASATETSPAGGGGDGGLGGNGSLLYSESGGGEYANYAGGGGIANAGTLTMTASTISANKTGAGGNGGGAGLGGERENHTFEDGGHGGEAGGGGLGGGLLSYGTANGSGTNLTNVTIAGNLTGDGGTGGSGSQGSGSLGGGSGGFGGYGGGIWAFGASSGNGLLLTHVTVSQNHLGAAGVGGADAQFPGYHGERGKGAGIAAGPRFSPGSAAGVYLKNTLVAANGVPGTDLNCVQYYPPDQYVDLGDLGHNLSYPDTSCPGVNADPLLGALQENGGPTETMLPGPGGAAIGAIPAVSCVGTEDQRGYPRPGGGKSSCDIGAVETGPPPGVTATATSLTSSANPSTPSQQVTFTATVSPIPGAGNVSFTDGGSVIPGCGSASFTGGGQASCQVTFPTVGSHAILANYLGDSEFEASSSATLTQVVQSPQGSGGSGGGGGAGGGGSGLPGPSSPKPKAVHCPKSKKRVVHNGKVKCVSKHRHKAKHH